MIFFSFLTDFSYFPLIFSPENCWTVRTGKKMTILKGGLNGFSYFSMISVIVFSKQDHPCSLFCIFLGGLCNELYVNNLEK